MVRIFQSKTFPINPPGAEPVLSVEQFWEVLQIKSRRPEIFIPAMASTTVLQEHETGLSREVVFREGVGRLAPPGGKLIEDLTFFKPWKVDFKSRGELSSLISNLVSQGEDETDLYLTFFLEWNFPDMQEGSEEKNELAQQLSGFAKDVLRETIDIARKMVKDGEIKV